MIRAISYIAIIVLGYCLRRAGFFKSEDFGVLSKIVLKITLPAAIVTNFASFQMEPSMLTLAIPGFLGGAGLILLGLVANARGTKSERAFAVMNIAGYNIGNFTMPFAQSFLGPMGVVTTSLFDTGNSVICLGGAYSIAAMAKGEKSEAPIRTILGKLVRSVPFDTYVIMVLISLFRIPLPSVVTSFAGIIGNANAFTAMLMIGVGFKLSGDKSQIRQIAKILSLRYGFAAVMAAGLFFLLPIDLGYRQALAILCFSPIASAAPAFTGMLGEDVGLASAVNSISIIISIVLITATLLLVL